MKYRAEKQVSLLFICSLLSACTKYYNCDNYNVKYVQCTKAGADTVFYLTQGYSEQNQRMKEYYEGLGYTCKEITNYIGAYARYENVTDIKDVKYLESQGFVCVQKER